MPAWRAEARQRQTAGRTAVLTDTGLAGPELAWPSGRQQQWMHGRPRQLRKAAACHPSCLPACTSTHLRPASLASSRSQPCIDTSSRLHVSSLCCWGGRRGSGNGTLSGLCALALAAAGAGGTSAAAPARAARAVRWGKILVK